MSKNTRTKSSDDRMDFIVGIITVIAVVALFVFLFARMTQTNKALGAIAYAGELRRGNEQEISCEVNPDMVKNGDKIVWTVNGKKVSESVYESDRPVTLNYIPDSVGTTHIAVKVGKYRRSTHTDVLPPQLTLTAPNIVITYGDQLPQMNYDCCGFVDEDNKDSLCYDGTCSISQYTNCGDVSKLGAGVYKIEFSKPCAYKDYDVNYVNGTLTVLPKELTVSNEFVKTYDQTNVIKNPKINLKGVVAGDNVTASCKELYFDNKNAGEDKTIMLSNVTLQGQDCKNYCLQKETHGTIKPKKISLDGMTVQDKLYDGTTKASIEQLGELNGVYGGDSIAIGSVDVRFDEAFIGEREVVVENVTLIGLDKDNYVLQEVKLDNAEITAY